jgi:hypothetical protein
MTLILGTIIPPNARAYTKNDGTSQYTYNSLVTIDIAVHGGDLRTASSTMADFENLPYLPIQVALPLFCCYRRVRRHQLCCHSPAREKLPRQLSAHLSSDSVVESVSRPKAFGNYHRCTLEVGSHRRGP